MYSTYKYKLIRAIYENSYFGTIPVIQNRQEITRNTCLAKPREHREHEARDLSLGDCLFHGPETILKQTGFKVTGKPFFLHILNVS